MGPRAAGLRRQLSVMGDGVQSRSTSYLRLMRLAGIGRACSTVSIDCRGFLASGELPYCIVRVYTIHILVFCSVLLGGNQLERVYIIV